MTCADNISAFQHEKRACRVKCTLHTQGQAATKTNGTTLTESRGKNEDSTDLSTPLGIDCPITADDTAQFSMVSLASFCLQRWTFDVLLQTDLFITWLPCAEPVTRFHDSFPDSFLVPRPDPTNQRPRRVSPSESARLLCCVNPSRSSGHEFVQRCVFLNSGCLFVSK